VSSNLIGNQITAGWLDPLAARLQKMGLAGLAAVFLEAGSPLAPLAAQGIYISQPLLEIWLPKEHLLALAALLEDERQTAALAQTLREVQA